MKTNNSCHLYVPLRNALRVKMSETVTNARSRTSRHFVSGTLFITINALLFFYWAGVVANNTIFVHGYPSLGTELPGPFVSTRYKDDWFWIFALGLNALLPLTFAMALAENQVQEYGSIHRVLSIIMVVVNALLVLAFLLNWCLDCNWFHSVNNTPCNSYKWCGVYFGASAAAANICPNIVPFVPNVVAGDLHINGEYLQHLIASGIFLILAFVNWAVNKYMAGVGIFTNEAI